MEQGPSWERSSCSPGQEFHSNLWNPKVHLSVHKHFTTCPYSERNESNLSLLYYSISLRSKLILAHDLDRGLPSSPFPLGFPNKTWCAFLSTMHAAWLKHITLVGMNTQIIFHEEYKLWSSSMCNFLQHCYFLLFMFKHYIQHCVSMYP
jgi:hypothetical protein